MIGTILNMRYEVTELVDAGPVFKLFAAKDRQRGHQVWLRMLNDEFKGQPGFDAHLRQAVRDLSGVQSRRAERYLEVLEEEGELILLSDGPTGTLLSERILRLAPYTVPVAVSLMLQILEAMEGVHDAGFAHGELTPHVILMAQDGEVGVMQAGLWMAYSSSANAGAATMKRVAPYLAPEIYGGKLPSPTSDIYSAGVIFFELLTARTPFVDDNLGAMANKHLSSPVPSLRQINPSVGTALEEIVRKALSKDPAARYASPSAFAADLKALQASLRFGKNAQFSSPTKAPAAPAPAPTPAKAVVSQPAPAAPKAAPLPTEVAPEPKKPKGPPDSGRAPSFLRFLGYAGVLTLVVLIAGWFSWNLTAPKPMEVPALMGMQAADASQKLKELGLTLRVAREQYSDKAQGVILETSPRKGEKVRENSFISAVVSAGPRFVKVPDLRGETLESARTKIEPMDLTLSDFVEEVFKRGQEPGAIVEQIPEPGSQVDRGSKIRVAVASNRDRRSRAERVRAEYELILRMPPENPPLYARVEIVDADGTRTVYPDTLLQPGEVRQVITKGRGTSVDFRVFFNGKLVQQVTQKPTNEDEENA